jgi:hypothetical protein
MLGSRNPGLERVRGVFLFCSNRHILDTRLDYLYHVQDISKALSIYSRLFRENSLLYQRIV